ncbi:hypothetical protein BGZ79_000718 [Entomortierella chlamydospora]|nr:hypothetical protein BGZ79_000718 [Entomortierella chlamydospora]
MLVLNTTYTGSINSYTEHRNTCPEISCSVDERVAAISAAIFGSNEDGTSACGKYVKVSQGNPTEHHTIMIVDICSECEGTSLGLSNAAVDQFANISTDAIDWKLIEADNEDVEREIVKRRLSRNDMIVALNQAQRDRIRFIVKIVDTCPHRFCSHGQLDSSQAAFKKFAPMFKGILDLELNFSKSLNIIPFSSVQSREDG